MTDPCDFLNALYSSSACPIPVCINGVQTVTDKPDYADAVDGVYEVAANTCDGVAFLIGAMEGVERSDVESCRLPPTVALYKDGTLVLAWSLDKLASHEDAAQLAAEAGMEPVETYIPMPPSGGWEILHANPECFYTLEQLRDAYAGGDDDGGVQNQTDEANVEDISENEALGEAEGDVTGRDGFYYDARILAPYSEADYSNLMTVTHGAGRKSLDWLPRTIKVATLIKSLSQHKEHKDKDGHALVFADMARGQRLKTAVKSLWGIGLDIDTGTPSGVMDAALLKLGCLALRYTTHSAFKTESTFRKDLFTGFAGDCEIDTALVRRYLTEVKAWDQSVVDTAEFLDIRHTTEGIMVFVTHCPMPKHRVIVPLGQPFVIADEAPTQAEAMKKWAKVPTALATILGVPLDKSCTDPSRLFYLPRHAKGRPFEITLFGGPLFDWHTLRLDDPYEMAVQELNKGKAKSVTPEGRELGRWSVDHSFGFQAADAVNDFAPDKIRGSASQGYDIECPFDENHSNSGAREDRACFVVNAGEGSSEFFTISCRHESCRDKTMLDMLGKMLKDRWFDKSVLEDESYNAIVEGANDACLSDAPSAEVTGVTRDQIDGAIEAMVKPVSAEAAEDVIRLVAKAELSELQLETILLQLKALTGSTMKPLRATLHRMRRETEVSFGSGGSDHKAPRELTDALSHSLRRPFTLPPEHMGSFFLERVDGHIWISRHNNSDKGDSDRLCAPFVLTGGIIYADRDQAHAFRVEVLNSDGKWTAVEIDAGALASTSGVTVLEQVLRAGFSLTKPGRDFFLEYLTTVRTGTRTVYHRPGFRNGAFVCPTGEVVLGGDEVELAQEVRLTCRATAGGLESWKSATGEVFAMPNAHRLQAGVLIGWTGALCDLAEDDPLAFALEGGSTLGKSTTQMLSAAHWADPELGEGLFLLSKGTENSQELPLERGSGTLTALDEIGQLPAKAQQDLIFMNQAGTAKRRMTQRGTAQKTRKWGGSVLIVSAETGFAQRLAMEGVQQMGGLSARVVAIPFDTDARLLQEQFAEVKNALANFGWSGPAFIRSLAQQGYVEDPSKLHKEIKELVLRLPETGGQENAFRRRSARPIAYMWAAGLIAAKAGLTPAGFDYEGLAMRIWSDALASDIGPTDPVERALLVLIDAITSRKGTDIFEFAQREHGHREAVGYFNAEVDGKKVYVLRSAKLAELSGGFVDSRALRKKLDERGYLVRPKDGDARTWSGFGGLGKTAQYVVLYMDAIDAAAPDVPAQKRW